MAVAHHRQKTLAGCLKQWQAVTHDTKFRRYANVILPVIQGLARIAMARKRVQMARQQQAYRREQDIMRDKRVIDITTERLTQREIDRLAELEVRSPPCPASG